jgi:hypothetical protein
VFFLYLNYFHVIIILDELPSLQVNPDKLHVINELVDKSVALVVLGYSNIARAVLTNELVGGKPLFPVVSYNIV